jgi:hypothetical protein
VKNKKHDVFIVFFLFYRFARDFFFEITSIKHRQQLWNKKT